MTATSRCLETAPRRSLTEVRHDLIVERLSWLSRQMDAETQAEADYCAREIAAVEARLRAIDEAGAG